MPEGPRHPCVHLRDDEPGVLGGRKRAIDGDAKAAVAVRVRRRDLDERHIERERSAGRKQSRDLREEDGRVVRPPFGHGATYVRADEQRVMAEMAAHLRGDIGSWSVRMHVDEFDIAEVFGAPHQRFEERQRGGRAPVQIDALSGANLGRGLSGRRAPHHSAPRAAAARVLLGALN